jgi:mannitol/fructose-specific phosphotransferase system IIA component
VEQLFRRRLGEMLLEDGIIGGEGLEHALEYAKRTSTPLGRSLLDLQLIDQSTLAAYLERQLGESLVERGILNHSQLADVCERAQTNGEPLGRVIARRGYADDEELAQIMAEDYGLPCLRLIHMNVRRDVARIVSREHALQTLFLPVDISDDVMTVATARPYDELTVKALEEGSGLKATLIVVPERDLRAAIRYYLPD